MRQLLISTALLLAVPTFGAAQGSTCPDGTMTCNIATVGDTDISAPQTIGDTVNPTYSPDSASANASTGAIDVDNIVQGDTITTEATGNTSTNDNRSTANNSGSANVTGGNITSSGGNITSSADTTGGNIDSTAVTASGPATTVGGNIDSSATTTSGAATTTSGPATTVGGTAMTASGPANTNSGNITSSGGAGGASNSESAVLGSGNSASDSRATGGNSRATGGRATGGNSRAVTGASTSRATGGAGGRATGGRSSSGGNTISGGNSRTNIDASQRTTIRHAANTAAMINSQGYGGQNCLGDTNPSGQFGASIQTFGWGVTANSMKASNVCALLKIGGQRAALAYLAGMDPNARRALLNNGLAVTRAQIEAQVRAEAEAERQQQRRASTQKLACPSGYDLTARQDGSMTCRVVEIDQTPRQVAAPMPPAGTSCPAGSRWDGKGCWMARK